MAFLVAPLGATASDFVLDGRVAELDRVILAREGGVSVTAFDVLLYLDMIRNPAVDIEVDQWLAEGDGRDRQTWGRIRRAVEKYLATMSLARQAPASTAPGFLRSNMLAPAVRAVWMEEVIRPRIFVARTDVDRYYIAHPELYSSPGRVQVRYVFLAVPKVDEFDRILRERETDLGILRDRIEAGELTFEEAARARSDAPSSEFGGLIPEFEPGTHFADFEDRAFALSEPGRMSEVFNGSGGAYLLQLVSYTPASRTPLSPEVDAEIRRRLSHEHARSYYVHEYNKLVSGIFVRDQSGLWRYANQDAPVAVVGTTAFGRDELLRLNPSVIDADYGVKSGAIRKETERWIETQTLMIDLRARGLTAHLYLDRAGRIADAIIASRSVLRGRVDRSLLQSTEAALAALGKDPGQPPGIPQSRVVQFAIRPVAEALADPERAEAALELMAQLSDRITTGQLPIEIVTIEFKSSMAEAMSEGEESFAAELDRIRGFMDLAEFPDLQVVISDEGWKDSLYGLRWRPSLSDLAAGQVGAAESEDDGVYHYYVAATRVTEDSAWLQTPLLLQTALFDLEVERLFEDEVARIRGSNLIEIGPAR